MYSKRGFLGIFACVLMLVILLAKSYIPEQIAGYSPLLIGGIVSIVIGVFILVTDIAVSLSSGKLVPLILILFGLIQVMPKIMIYIETYASFIPIEKVSIVAYGLALLIILFKYRKGI